MSTLCCPRCHGSIFDCDGCPDVTARPSRRGEVVATLDRGVTVETGRQVSALPDDEPAALPDPEDFAEGNDR